MKFRTVFALAIMMAFALVVSTQSAAVAQSQAGGKVNVRIVGANNGKDVMNGGVSGRGHFRASGAVVDRGKVVAYRRVKGDITTGTAVITLRFVTHGRKGTITYRVKIDLKARTSRWTIMSATKKYKGLHGSGHERENADHTIAVLTGTVRR
jgi:O-acetyl-ADP-ribose deacetylase (regulator of RNase III)